MRPALRGWDAELVDEDEVERKLTRYILQEGAVPLLLAVVRMMLTRPTRLSRARASLRSEKGKADGPARRTRSAAWAKPVGFQADRCPSAARSGQSIANDTA
jgi:hypothetical protein